MQKLDRKLIGLTVLAALLGVAGAYYGQPLVHGNDQATSIIVTVCSILVGFLVAIIAIIGDPLLVPPGSWRIAEGNRQKTVQRLTRHKRLLNVMPSTVMKKSIALPARSEPGSRQPFQQRWVARASIRRTARCGPACRGGV